MRNAFIIGAGSSGAGKTTLSLGLMRALQRRGLDVQPFKCGPDFIDTQYHYKACGKASINLDLFMAYENHVRNLFSYYSSGEGVSVVEGVMGLFDGYERMKGSAAEIAMKLDIPVILLINAASSAYSVAPMIYGYSRFMPDVRIAGVIFNRVASRSHYKFLEEAAHDAGVAPLGYLSRNSGLVVPSRHLGLSLDSSLELEKFIDMAADEVTENIDIAKVLEITEINIKSPVPSLSYPGKGIKVAVANDEAFNFIYPENLKAFGGEITFFSPLHDVCLPAADIVYLPGGYPELFAEQLERNAEMRNQIREFAEAGGRILAECGGMIYLTQDIDGKKMCGVLPLSTTMENARLKLGYRIVSLPAIDLRGHEFHYSSTLQNSSVKMIGSQRNVRKEETGTPVYRYKNVIATYTHLYWAEKDIMKIWE